MGNCKVACVRDHNNLFFTQDEGGGGPGGGGGGGGGGAPISGGGPWKNIHKYKLVKKWNEVCIS